jgi:hypothetical protein
MSIVPCITESRYDQDEPEYKYLQLKNPTQSYRNMSFSHSTVTRACYGNGLAADMALFGRKV